MKIKGVNFHEKFKYHYFGPYSPDLQLEIEELVDRKYLNENLSNLPYHYKLNSNISFERNNSISDKEDFVKYLSKQNYQELEVVSTIYYLIENNGITDENIIKKKLAALKPHLKGKFVSSFILKEQIDNYTFTSEKIH